MDERNYPIALVNMGKREPTVFVAMDLEGLREAYLAMFRFFESQDFYSVGLGEREVELYRRAHGGSEIAACRLLLSRQDAEYEDVSEYPTSVFLGKEILSE